MRSATERLERVAILGFGTRGDVQPCAALAHALAARSIHARLFVYTSAYADALTDQGVDVYQVGFDLQRKIESTPSLKRALESGSSLKFFEAFDKAISTDEHVRLHEELIREVVAYAPSIVLSSLITCSAAQILLEKFGLPSMRLDLQNGVPTREQPCPVLEDLCLPSKCGWLNNLTWRLMVMMLRSSLMSGKNAKLRAGYGLESYTSYYSWRIAQRPLFPSLLCVSQHLFRTPADWKPLIAKGDVRVVGALTIPTAQDAAAADVPSDLEQFVVGALEPPVYIGWGSMMFGSAAHLTELALRALIGVSERGVILRGWAGLGIESLDPRKPCYEQLVSFARSSVYFADTVPHEWLFPRCKLTVHHGGAGTTHAALRAGRPTVITPVCFDQAAFARLVSQNGCGVAAAPLRQLTADVLGTAIRAVQAPAVVERARDIGHFMRREDPVSQIVKAMEDFLARHADADGFQQQYYDRFTEWFGNAPACASESSSRHRPPLHLQLIKRVPTPSLSIGALIYQRWLGGDKKCSVSPRDETKARTILTPDDADVPLSIEISGGGG